MAWDSGYSISAESRKQRAFQLLARSPLELRGAGRVFGDVKRRDVWRSSSLGGGGGGEKEEEGGRRKRMKGKEEEETAEEEDGATNHVACMGKRRNLCFCWKSNSVHAAVH
jgi:hypothetical protein